MSSTLTWLKWPVWVGQLMGQPPSGEGKWARIFSGNIWPMPCMRYLRPKTPSAAQEVRFFDLLQIPRPTSAACHTSCKQVLAHKSLFWSTILDPHLSSFNSMASMLSLWLVYRTLNMSPGLYGENALPEISPLWCSSALEYLAFGLLRLGQVLVVCLWPAETLEAFLQGMFSKIQELFFFVSFVLQSVYCRPRVDFS